MLSDFCTEKLCEEIKASCVAFDGHPVTNLISENPNIRRKGFLAGSFVKPPVTISLKFKCSIKLSYVSLSCQVGSQRSSTFQIYSSDETDAAKTRISREELTPNQNKLVVCRLEDRPKRISEIGDCPNSKISEFYSFKNIWCVKSLEIVILRTDRSTVPALGRLEIWGYPANEKAKEIFSSLSATLVSSNNEELKIPNPEPKFLSKRIPYCKAKLKPGVAIPEDFVDPITCEVMTLPMILPSGKIIDMTTLEKFYEAEATQGRSPSDPFTGLLFNDFRKPSVAESLKFRIDKFLLSNSDAQELQTIPRAVGKHPLHYFEEPRKKMKSDPPTSYWPPNPSYQTPSSSTSSKAASKACDVSLDDVIEESLKELPLLSQAQSKSVECGHCKTSILLFKIPCDHFICRTCLLAAKASCSNSCSVCLKEYHTNEVSRFHHA